MALSSSSSPLLSLFASVFHEDAASLSPSSQSAASPLLRSTMKRRIAFGDGAGSSPGRALRTEAAQSPSLSLGIGGSPTCSMSAFLEGYRSASPMQFSPAASAIIKTNKVKARTTAGARFQPQRLRVNALMGRVDSLMAENEWLKSELQRVREEKKAAERACVISLQDQRKDVQKLGKSLSESKQQCKTWKDETVKLRHRCVELETRVAHLEASNADFRAKVREHDLAQEFLGKAPVEQTREPRVREKNSHLLPDEEGEKLLSFAADGGDAALILPDENTNKENSSPRERRHNNKEEKETTTRRRLQLRLLPRPASAKQMLLNKSLRQQKSGVTAPISKTRASSSDGVSARSRKKEKELDHKHGSAYVRLLRQSSKRRTEARRGRASSRK